MVERTMFEGHECIILKSGSLRVVVLPGLGGKIASFTDTQSGFDFAYVNPFTGIVKHPYDSIYATSDSGFGDLFPNIGVGFYPKDPWKGVPLPDKGEIWTQPMLTKIEGDCVELTCMGVRFPYSYKKKIRAYDDNIDIAVEVVNLSGFEDRKSVV